MSDLDELVTLWNSIDPPSPESTEVTEPVRIAPTKRPRTPSFTSSFTSAFPGYSFRPAISFEKKVYRDEIVIDSFYDGSKADFAKVYCKNLYRVARHMVYGRFRRESAR